MPKKSHINEYSDIANQKGQLKQWEKKSKLPTQIECMMQP